MYGTIFSTFGKCRSHACGITRVQSYTDQDMSSLSDRFTASTSLFWSLLELKRGYLDLFIQRCVDSLLVT